MKHAGMTGTASANGAAAPPLDTVAGEDGIAPGLVSWNRKGAVALRLDGCARPPDRNHGIPSLSTGANSLLDSPKISSRFPKNFIAPRRRLRFNSTRWAFAAIATVAPDRQIAVSGRGGTGHWAGAAAARTAADPACGGTNRCSMALYADVTTRR
jgi:hypothetical protein